uniref:Transmembrane protein 230 n=1 Tax=Panagrellus redivivus TaxID=6233 RepID=A0A7E4V9B0_PANRE
MMRRNKIKKEYRPMENEISNDYVSDGQREDDGGFDAKQFQVPINPEVPWAALLLAVSLTLIGSFLLIVFTNSYLYGGDKAETVSISVFLIGWIAFIPGFYHLVIAYYAYHKVPGYSYADIPNFD